MGYAQPGTDALTLTNESDDIARTVLLGGTSFEDEIAPWWNFIGRSHEDIAKARDDWQNSSDRFGADVALETVFPHLPCPMGVSSRAGIHRVTERLCRGS
ncbi:pirin-like C-terminal cupin domain-containing protein [Streptomyces incanus]|uniref:Pirin-like C-terminal cupin domain-containing protein n=1 Tax=Streptomyces incanus TaxID=887453 RepID=A0ABW0XNI6_9ACTN